jgi:hypothetical protein
MTGPRARIVDLVLDLLGPPAAAAEGTATGDLPIRAWGRSMWPLIPPGSRLAIDRDRSRLRPGDVAVGVRHGRVVAHRVVRVEDDAGAVRVSTRGDALAGEDPPWRPDELLGVVEAIVLGGVEFRFDRGAGRAIGAWAVRHPDLVRSAGRLLSRAVGACRAAGALGMLASDRLGVLPLAERDLGPADAAAVDRLRLSLGVRDDSPGAGGDAVRGRGVFLGDRLGAARVERAIPGGVGGETLLLVHPLLAGAADRRLAPGGEAAVRRIPPAPRRFRRLRGFDRVC